MNHEAVVKRFNNTDKTNGRGANVFIDGNRIYSYGHHFTLAIKREYGCGIRFLVNGDRYSVSTSKHTTLCIRNLDNNVQIPFSALTSARIDPEKLDVVDYRPDTTIYKCKECKQLTIYNTALTETTHDDGTELCKDLEGNQDTTSEHTLGAVLIRYDGRLFLSSMDDNEKTRSYFLCELSGNVRSVSDAFTSLRPTEVKEAYAAGLEVKRQGDMFFIPVTMTTRELKNNDPALSQVGVNVSTSWPRLYGSNHKATEGLLFFGEWYVRGTVRHEPEARRPDHGMLTLGSVWHRVVKNTAVQGWGAVGNVD